MMFKKNSIAVFFVLVFLSADVFSFVDLCIDPGHGGTASGTENSNYPNLFEKDVNLAVALAVLLMLIRGMPVKHIGVK